MTIITLTGPSGVGKGYVREALRKYFCLQDMPVYTTRKPRPVGEDVTRVFLSDEVFDAALARGEFDFVNDLFGARYGVNLATLKKPGPGFVGELYVDNVPGFRGEFPSSNMIALLPRSQGFLRKRLAKRGEEPVSASQRVEAAEAEVAKIKDISGSFNLVYEVDENNEGLVVDDILKYAEVFNAIHGRVRGPQLLRQELCLR